MPEPLTDAYRAETQQIIAAVPIGPWHPITNDYGVPDGVGPISFLETASDEYQVPVIAFVSHAREALPRYVGEVARLKTELDVSRRETAAARRFAEDMRDYCSPRGVSRTYADRLVEAMDRARLPKYAEGGVRRDR
ncbi:hypothetical protein WB388_09010 [Streptomyces brasiliscabiei]|uniref:Uncharacterized protein n=1 Tax=Streptomyces brasiliscabiei TaxID=2736302 RepID=A0ABU8GAC0_9ACTN